MSRKVTVKVGPDGSVRADFTGFAGDDCIEEADRLAETLARFGLKVNPIEARKKTAAEIEAEIDIAEPERDRVPAKED